MLAGLVVGLVVGDLLGMGHAPAYAGWGFVAGVARALLMGVWVTTQGVRVRNPWRSYRVAWSDVGKVVDFRPPQPNIGFGGVVPALILAHGSKQLPLYPLLAVGPWTGRLGSYNRYLRDRAEAIGLRVTDVDFLRRRLSVRQTVEEVSGHVRVIAATKSEAGRRTFALPAFLVDELAAHVARYRPKAGVDDLVFLGPRGGMLRRSFEARIFRPAVEAAGLPPALTFHGLRHVATTLMIANNEHPKVIQHRLGHADPAMSLGVYGHVRDDLDQAAARRLDLLFRSTGDKASPEPRARARVRPGS